MLSLVFLILSLWSKTRQLSLENETYETKAKLQALIEGHSGHHLFQGYTKGGICTSIRRLNNLSQGIE